MKKREINKVHRWVETNVSHDDAALGFVIMMLASITVVVGTLFAVLSWWLA